MANPVLRRFDVRILVDMPDSDHEQITAAGATIDFYRAGATVRETVTVPGIADRYAVPVFDSGDIKVGDTVQAGWGGAEFAILAEPAFGVVYLSSEIGAVEIPAGTRLIPTNNRPTITDDPTGLTGGETSLETDADGRAEGYVVASRFDYHVSGEDPEVDQLHVDSLGGTAPSPSWLNARDFPTVQDAIDALPDGLGGTVFLPAGVYEIDLPEGADPEDPGRGLITITNPGVTLRGEGPMATILRRVSESDAECVVAVEAGGCRLHDLQIDGANIAGSCLELNGQHVTLNNKNASAYLQNVILTNAHGSGDLQGYGLLMREGIGTVAVNVRFEANARVGARVIEGSTTTRFLGCAFKHNAGKGLELDGFSSSITALGCVFQDNAGGSGISEGNSIDVRNNSQLDVLGCQFRITDPEISPQQFIYAELATAPTIGGCWFDGGPSGVDRVAKCVNTRGVQFANNSAIRVATEVLQLVNASLATSNDAVEMGNRSLGSDPPVPIIASPVSARIVTLSRGGLGVDNWDGTPETSVGTQSGALAYVESSEGLKVLAQGMPAYDANSSGGGNISGGGQLSFNHAVASHANRVIYVTVVSRQITAAGEGVDIGAVKFNGDEMTLMKECTTSATRNAVYRMFGPDVGTHAVTVDVTGDSSDTMLISAGCEGFYDADQGDVVNQDSGTGSNSGPTINCLTTVVGSLVCDSLAVIQDSGLVTRGVPLDSGQTIRHDRGDSGGSPTKRLSSTSSTKESEGGTVGKVYTLSGSRPWSIIVWEVRGPLEWRDIEIG